MLHRILYYTVAVPMALLPLWLIYFFGTIFYLFIFYLKPYRKKVVYANLNRSFPIKSEQEIKAIAHKFYRYFTDLLAESVKNLFISKSALKKRFSVRNPELLEQFYDQDKNVILLSSHFNNWEFLITAQALLFRFQAVGIGTPLSNKFWDVKMTQRRERFGMKVVNAKNYKEFIISYTGKPMATLVLGDQSPGKDENCYWLNFLNQETAFYFGAEFMANEFDMPVVCGVIHRVARGKYELELKLITAQPKTEEYGFITESYVRILEDTIKAKPEYWLWSHKRWKKNVPENLQAIKSEHKQRFIQRFRS